MGGHWVTHDQNDLVGVFLAARTSCRNESVSLSIAAAAERGNAHHRRIARLDSAVETKINRSVTVIPVGGGQMPKAQAHAPRQARVVLCSPQMTGDKH
ncbi:light-independent protochlorophyllide reductase subunit N [Bradyrhizobium oligotrophicum S58]|uniref:Light-independent protochlorophyllide reductase subunit N n=1 Tax=Bradyrhizobium oligotrophicum S58 TaxID=1245469 RepID=M4Z3H6_9BRAD|nr:light-independent protochlorophyllide reductase subunit N [Bradyrhizobium oligotrophicum S58]